MVSEAISEHLICKKFPGEAYPQNPLACAVYSSKHRVMYTVAINDPLTTNNAFWCCRILAACYHLTQSVLKIGSVLAESVGQGEVSGCTVLADTLWSMIGGLGQSL